MSRSGCLSGSPLRRLGAGADPKPARRYALLLLVGRSGRAVAQRRLGPSSTGCRDGARRRHDGPRIRVPLPLDAGQVLGLHVELVVLPPIRGRRHHSGLAGDGGEPLATSVASAPAAAPAVATAAVAVAASTEGRPP
jgi:hypothetical protein